jgi:hypothetical protein
MIPGGNTALNEGRALVESCHVFLAVEREFEKQ